MASVAVHLGPVMTCLRLHHQRILVDSSCPLRLSYRARIGQCQVIVLMPQIARPGALIVLGGLDHQCGRLCSTLRLEVSAFT